MNIKLSQVDRGPRADVPDQVRLCHLRLRLGPLQRRPEGGHGAVADEQVTLGLARRTYYRTRNGTHLAAAPKFQKLHF